jgi:hypothetical protein
MGQMRMGNLCWVDGTRDAAIKAVNELAYACPNTLFCLCEKGAGEHLWKVKVNPLNPDAPNIFYRVEVSKQ